MNMPWLSGQPLIGLASSHQAQLLHVHGEARGLTLRPPPARAGSSGATSPQHKPAPELSDDYLAEAFVACGECVVAISSDRSQMAADPATWCVGVVLLVRADACVKQIREMRAPEAELALIKFHHRQSELSL